MPAPSAPCPGPGRRPPVVEGDGTDHPLAHRSGPHFADQPVVTTGTGLAVPALGFGTWQLEPSAAEVMVAEALDVGVRHIDTAQMYANEAAVGAALAASPVDRDEVFVTTKIDDDHHEPDDLVASLAESLRDLGTDHVDLLLVHWPVHWERMGATLHTLAQVQASGMAHHIGVSNSSIDQLEQMADLAPLEVLQVECHPYLQQSELRSWCVEHDWVFTAYSPVAQGQVLDDPTLTRIAQTHDTSPTAVALAWLLGQDRVTAIPRTSDPDHLRTNWSARDLTLDADELARIDGVTGPVVDGPPVDGGAGRSSGTTCRGSSGSVAWTGTTHRADPTSDQ